VIERTLAKRYASALLAVTHKENAVEETETTLLSLRQVWEKDAKFRAVLTSPKVRKSDRKALLRRVLASASKAVQEFADLLVEKNRVDLLPDVADQYDRLADAFRGVVRVQVASAFPLSEEQKARLTGALQKVTGKSCSLEATVNPSLKAGLQVRMGDSVVDGTIAYRLKSLRFRLEELQKR
jgi:F-type H+-transporting ATPase subunit delta